MNKARCRMLPHSLASLAALLVMVAASAHAATSAEPSGNSLESIDSSVLPGNRVELRFHLSKPIAEPRSFTIRDPARIALDFPGTRNATGQRRIPLDVGVAQSVLIAEAKDRTRIVLNLSEVPEFDTRTEDNTVVLTLGGTPGSGGSSSMAAAPSGGAASAGGGEPFTGESTGSGASAPGERELSDVSFRRGEDGQGRVVLEMSTPDIPVNIERQGRRVVVQLKGTSIPAKFRKRLDVLDFATPVKYVDIRQKNGDGQIEILPRTEDYEQLAYQSENTVTVELKPLTEEEMAQKEREKPKYTGEKVSLNFQDIEIRSVLQLLADFTGLNVVVSDSVSGSLTLRLRDVPWDQALDIILTSKGLGKRRNGNVIFIAPQQEIAAREEAELKAQQQVSDLAPLRTEYVQVDYAKASELADILKSDKSTLLSERGNVTVDERTNTLLIQDTADNIENARRLISRLDIPVRQVLIESRIVIATDDFNKELGVRFGVDRDTTNNDGQGVILGGNSDAITNLGNNQALGTERFNVNLPANNPAGSIGLALAKLPFGTLLELELSAMQAEGRGEVVSSPRVITANQKEAHIEQGVEIPYQEASSSGATSVSFKKAVLSLSVTPQITPDDRIVMDLSVTKDQVGQIFSGVPSIDTREVNTQVLVDNGETVVLGGIYEQTKNDQVTRVPFFGDLPLVGALFRSKIQKNNKSELLVFVTPKVVKGGTNVQY